MAYELSEFDVKVYKADRLGRPKVKVSHRESGITACCCDTPSELLNRSRAIAAIARVREGEQVLSTDMWIQLCHVKVLL